MRKIHFRKTWPLILCFLSPIFIMACYFAYRNMSPFGHQSILTVDLGQQYVDFFAYFKHVLFAHPSGIFYSFSKAYGGEMLGTWAYYLMSPVNLILLFIPLSHLPAGILLIILLKYGLSGLSFGYLLTRTLKPDPCLTIMWSIIYALNGWIIANQINVMWLDGMIWLPLVILGIIQIFHQSHSRIYLIALMGAIITNYYMGYMISIFACIYVLFELMQTHHSLTVTKRILKHLALSTATCLGLCAWLILPTGYALFQGKAHYTHPILTNHFEYFPFKMVSKLFNGSLNFDQLPSGTPNIFVGSVALIGFLIYFFEPQIKLRKKLSVLFITGFLILSMCYQPLDIFWHAGQYPVWYPYRFSFIACFWMIWIAANAINPRYHINWMAKLIIASLISGLIIYVFVNRAQFPFISPLHFIVGIIILLIGFILLLYTHNDSKVFTFALLCFSIIEMSLNVCTSLNNLTYISNTSYTRPVHQLRSVLQKLPSSHSYRTGKSYYRSKDDPFSANYSGGDVFDSSLEYTTPRFMKHIGQPEGHGFATYSNGTLLSDQLLGYRYFLTTNDYQHVRPIFLRKDLANYPVIGNYRSLQIHRNPKELPLIFATYPSALSHDISHNPIKNQETWYRSITHNPEARFCSTKPNKRQLINVKFNHNEFKKINPLNPGYINLRFKPKVNYIYYLLINPHELSVTNNGRPLIPKTAFSHALILDLNSGRNQPVINLQIKILNHRLKPGDFHLYRLNAKEVLNKNYQANAKITHFNNCRITGDITATQSKTVMGSSIPATHGWHLSIDGHSKPIKPIMHEFIGTRVSPGRHRFKLIYVPPWLPVGILITSLTIIAVALKHRLNK